ncbi:MAG TPA: D-glycero-beta-D-manno-heptose 1-phosphate adenylyltransferase [Candidatus Cloacimonadota bacterium]|nr:D-glycero-beta-D-manno-heptose 1-phosphate adenylyltransferase [Candidatus Cloacimonadota bacterium]
MLADKIIERKDLALIRQEADQDDFRIVFTNGCFDLMHSGHALYLEEALAQGDILVVGVNSDDSVRRLKGSSRPIIPLRDRMLMLAALEAVDYVVAFDEDTPYELIMALKPDVLVKGGDWAPAEIVGSDLVLAKGGVVKSLIFKAGVSTSLIIEKIKAGLKDGT